MSLFPVLGSSAAGERLERVVASRQYREGGFHNTANVGPSVDAAPSFSVFREMFFDAASRKPRAPLPLLDPRLAWSASPETGLRTSWLGHSTVLVEIDGYRVLTDPVWGPRSSPVSWAGPARFHPPPVAIEDLPTLDAVLVSHDHYDHLDYGTILRLAKRDVPFVTSLGSARTSRAGASPRSGSSSSIGGRRQRFRGRICASPPPPHSISLGALRPIETARSGPRSAFADRGTASSSAGILDSRTSTPPSARSSAASICT